MEWRMDWEGLSADELGDGLGYGSNEASENGLAPRL